MHKAPPPRGFEKGGLGRTEVWVAPAADARAGCRPPHSAVLAPLNVAATLTERLTANPAVPRLRLDVSIPAVGLSVCRAGVP